MIFILRKQILNASFSRILFSNNLLSSLSVALRMTGFKGGTILLSSTSRGPITTSPYSTPRAVSTIALSPFLHRSELDQNNISYMPF